VHPSYSFSPCSFLRYHTADRKKTYNNSHGVGVFGDGIYTATNPFAFRHFGDTGLLVAVLLGNTARVPYTADPKANLVGTINTVIGNKSLRHLTGTLSEAIRYTDELVLQESKQCLPLMRFDTASVSTQAGKDAVWMFQQELQRLLDKVFNKGVRTELQRIHESATDPYAVRAGGGTSASSAAAMAAIASSGAGPFPVSGIPPHLIASLPPHLLARVGGSGSAGAAMGGGSGAGSASRRSSSRRSRPAAGGSPASSMPEVLMYTAPLILTTPTPSDAFVSCRQGSKEDCVICMESLSSTDSGRVVRLKECGHEYHKKCIQGALEAKPNCPVCRAMIRKPQGSSPSGTMSITTSRVCCSGYESCRRSIVITYTIPSGFQLSYHDNPGERYHGTTRIAYLPDNDDGRKLLSRLKFAWMQGLTFAIGTSLTTRQPNCVTWASIHHKTSPSGGPHGFPDPGFFLNCNGELDAAGVPK